MLDNPPQPEAADIREEDDDVPVPPAHVVVEGAGQSSGGEAAAQPTERDDDDRVPLSEPYKQPRSSTPEVAVDSSSPGAGEKVLGASAAATRPLRGGHKRLRMGLTLRPTATGVRLVL